MPEEYRHYDSDGTCAGHTSWSFGGFFFLSLYFYRFLCAAGRPTNGWALVATLLPSTFAAWVGATRVIDYYHNASDVLAGAAIGIFVSWLVFRVYVLQQGHDRGRRGELLPVTAAGPENPTLAQRLQSASVDVASLARHTAAARGGQAPFEMGSRQSGEPQHRSA